MAQKARGIGKNPPTLKYTGDKWNGKGSYSKNNQQGLFFGQIPSTLRRFIWHRLNGQQGNLIKIMELLIMTEQNFKVSKEWILKETGMASNKYYEARDKLCQMGFITYYDDGEEQELYVNYDFLWDEAFKYEKDTERIL